MFEQAKWIWRKDAEMQNVYVDFFDSFETNCPEKIKLAISADSNYALYLNGEYIPSRQFADYADDKVYDILDLSPFVQKGKNEIKITGYCLNCDTSTYRTEQVGSPSGALIYEFYEADKRLTASSKNTLSAVNQAYRNQGTEKVTGQLGFTFYYDAEKAQQQPVPSPSDEIERKKPERERPIRQLTEEGRIPSKLIAFGQYTEPATADVIGKRMQYAAKAMRPFSREIFPHKGIDIAKEAGCDGTFLTIDLGREESGTVDLEIELSENAEILIGWGEHILDNGVRAWVGGRNFCASYKGIAGLNRFCHPFLRMGCRYMTFFIPAKHAKVFYLGLHPTNYPVSNIPDFKCGDNLFNMIYETCKRTLLLCMHEHYEDCPWREQALYTMDSRNQMLCGYYAFGEYAFPKASLRLCAESLREDHMLELCSPARCSITIPSFSAIYAVQLYEYALYSGDLEFLAEMLPVAAEIGDGFAEHTDPNGILPTYTEAKYWNFYEWQPGLSGSILGDIKEDDITYDAPLAAFVSLCYGALEKAYGLIGDLRNAIRFSQLKDALNKAADQLFWDEEKGIYYSYINKKTGEKTHLCELTQALLLCCGAATGERADKVKKALTDSESELIPVTLAYSMFKYEALVTDPRYSEYVFCDIARQWGYMLRNEATTFWETINGSDDFSDGGSLCHGWSAVPIYFLMRYALGILPGGKTEPPVRSGISGLSGTVLLPDGSTCTRNN